MEVKADVAIVGAGPAGSTLAALLARRGLDVALIDRDRFPRDKVCGEFLSFDALPILEHLGVATELDRHRAPAIDRCRVVGRRHIYEFTFPTPARGVSRLLLDDLLCRTALTSGAGDWTGWTAVQIDPDRRRVFLQRGEDEATIQARLLVGAWGRWGRFDAHLARGFVRDRSHRHFGFKRHYRPQMPADGAIDLYSFRSGYLGVSAVEGGLTNICGLVHADRLTGLKGRWDAFVEAIRNEEPRLDRLYETHDPAHEDFLSSEPVIFRPRSPVEQGILMIGDASGIVDPLTGNGMAMAIQSAVLAAPFVVGGDLAGYRRAHGAFFERRISWSRRIAHLLSRPGLLEAALTTRPPAAAGQFLLRKTRASLHEIEQLLK